MSFYIGVLTIYALYLRAVWLLPVFRLMFLLDWLSFVLEGKQNACGFIRTAIVFTRSGLRKLHPFLFSWLNMILFSLRAPLFAEQLLTFAQLLMIAECRSLSAARAQSFLLFYPPSSPWFLLTFVEKTFEHLSRFSSCCAFLPWRSLGWSLRHTAEVMGDVLFSPFFANLPGWSPGWLASTWSVISGWRAQRAFVNSVHFAAATDWWCFVFRHCSKHRVEGGSVIALESGMIFWIFGCRFILEYWRYMLYICEPYGFFPFSGWCSCLTDCLLFWRENNTRVVLFEPIWSSFCSNKARRR